MSEMRIACIVCGAPMLHHSCKVRCPRCGIFYDCSDGMLPMPEADDLQGLGLEIEEPRATSRAAENRNP